MIVHQALHYLLLLLTDNYRLHLSSRNSTLNIRIPDRALGNVLEGAEEELPPAPLHRDVHEAAKTLTSHRVII